MFPPGDSIIQSPPGQACDLIAGPFLQRDQLLGQLFDIFCLLLICCCKLFFCRIWIFIFFIRSTSYIQLRDLYLESLLDKCCYCVNIGIHSRIRQRQMALHANAAADLPVLIDKVYHLNDFFRCKVSVEIIIEQRHLILQSEFCQSIVCHLKCSLYISRLVSQCRSVGTGGAFNILSVTKYCRPVFIRGITEIFICHVPGIDNVFICPVIQCIHMMNHTADVHPHTLIHYFF